MSRSIVGVAVEVSTVTASAVDAELRVPAPSSAFTVSEWIPGASAVDGVRLNVAVPPVAPSAIVPGVVAVAIAVVVLLNVSYSVT